MNNDNIYKIMDGNEAAAYASYNFTEVAAIYPITPASPMAELTDKWSGESKLNYFDLPVKVVEMQSEGGAAGMMHGSLLSGSLTTTYTASQGLLLMLPNMYKMAGELLPGVINVSARSLATHALSIFGDHQDIYSARSTGFAMLATSSPQEAMDLTSVAHLAAIKGRVPFMNFFDGFRTSHELQKIKVIDTDKVKKLIDEKALNEFRNRALNNENPVVKGTAQNEDIYFQATEIRNEYYDKLPDIVNGYMNEINKITNQNYAPFNYYGSKNATKVIVAMGSVCETIKETITYLNNYKNQNLGLIEVHLYRPFSTKYFLRVLPKTVKKIAVLDRTKEPGATGEPLYLDIVKIIKETEPKVNVYGGRYGLSSKNTTPAMIKGVYEFLDSKEVHSNFTVGIEDDITNLSIKYDEKFSIPSENIEFLIYGYGSDGMVSASKDLLQITGTYTKAYVQGYFQYDSKKSGGITISNLRFGKEPITSTYYVEKASLIVCTKDSYLTKIKMLEKIKKNGIFLLNTSKTPDEVVSALTNHDKKIIKEKNIKVFVIDANKIAKENGIPGKISSIMEILIFKLGKIIDFDFASDKIKENLKNRFKNKSGDLADKNEKAINSSIKDMAVVKIPNIEYDLSKEKEKTIFETIVSMEGDKLPVSSFVNNPDGTFESATTKLEKPNTHESAPSFDCSKCIACNMCSFVCPHAVIRPFLLDENEQLDCPESVKRNLIDAKVKDENLKFTIGVSLYDCTSCGLCVKSCPREALEMKSKKELLEDKKHEEYEFLFNEVSEKCPLPLTTVKGSQFATPKFEFPGACAGCGETPYLKLLTQLFGENLVIANATGCSSIYGGSTPLMPYSVPWANSLFEDNAEFGLGMKISDLVMKEKVTTVINNNLKNIKKSEEKIYTEYVENINNETANKLLEIVDNTKIKELLPLKKFIKPKSVWIVGGDGWAYDIGYSGIDHVIANNIDVNILVLDTEVYSNTGGQASKSTRLGAVAKFAANGKETAKKDLAKIALTYPHVYVGTISLGANPANTIKVLTEAEAYKGPSIILAYAPCIAQGLISGMSNSIEEAKNATNCGYFPIFNYNPDTEKFKLNSKADFSNYINFLGGEDRYRSLKNVNNNYKEILEQNKKSAEERYKSYQDLVDRDNYQK